MTASRSQTLFLGLALLSLVFLVLSACTARAGNGIVRVKVNGAISGTCGDQVDWSNACDLQYALTTVAVSGSELWVAAGTYTPTTGTDRTATFRLRNGVALYGGFAGSESLRSERNITANVTILSGDIGSPGNLDNSYHVVMGTGVTNTAVLDGFTVTGGNANYRDNPGSQGGGMYNNGGSPTLANIIFTGNIAIWDGGGMYNYDNSNPTLTNVAFSGNTAGEGGGMSNRVHSSPTITNATFTGNTITGTTGCGGGMYNDTSNPKLTNVTFSDNSASAGGGMCNVASNLSLTDVTFSSNSATDGGGGGGGMSNGYDSNPTLTNVTFSSNSATGSGGGMFNGFSNPALTNVTFSSNSGSQAGGMVNYNSSPTLTNVTLSGNSDWGMFNSSSSPTLTNVTFTGNSGYGMYNARDSSPTVRNTIFWGTFAPDGSQIVNGGGTSYIYDSVLEGGCPAGSTCDDHIINADPLLGALGNYGGSTETVPLLPGSSAIDAGNDATCPPTDQRGKPRVGTCDIGAFEAQLPPLQLPLVKR